MNREIHTRLGNSSQLAEYFTGRDSLLDALKLEVRGESNPSRIHYIQGSIGAGKTAILRMLDLWCLSEGIVSAYVVGKAQLTEKSFLWSIGSDLKRQKVKTPLFDSAWRKCKAEADKGGEAGASREMIEEKGLQSGVEAAKQIFSGVGWIGSVAAFIASSILWITGLVRRRQRWPADDRVAMLTEALLNDMAHAQQRISLIVDQFGALSPIEHWLCGFVRDLPGNTALTLAGREIIGDECWDTIWPGWKVRFRFDALDRSPLDRDQKRQMAEKLFCLLIGQAPQQSEINDIADNAPNPLVIETNVYFRVWGRTTGGREPQGVNDELEKLVLKNFDTESSAIAETAAVPRFLTDENLAALTSAEASWSYFADKANLIFLTPCDDCWIMQHSLREILLACIRTHNPKRYIELNQKASDYYRQLLHALSDGHLMSEKELRLARRWVIEDIYHSFQLSQECGMQSFRGHFDAAAFDRRDFELCRALINEVRSYRLSGEIGAWLDLCKLIIDTQENRTSKETSILLKKKLEDPVVRKDRELRLGVLQSLATQSWLSGDPAEAKQYYLKCYELSSNPPPKISAQAGALINLANLALRTGDSEDYLEKAASLCDQIGLQDKRQFAYLRKEYGDALRLKGHFEESERCIAESLKLYEQLHLDFEYAHALRVNAMLSLYMGRVSEAETLFNRCISIFEQSSATQQLRYFEDFWTSLGLGDVCAGKYALDRAAKHYGHALELCTEASFERSVVLGSLADLECLRGSWKTAETYQQESITLRKRFNDVYGEIWGMATRARILVGCNRPEEAELVLEKGIENARRHRYNFLRAQLLLVLCEASAASGHDSIFDKSLSLAEALCLKESYNGILAQLYALDLKRKVRIGDESVSDSAAVSDLLLSVFAHALQHNIYLLDYLLKDIALFLAGTRGFLHCQIILKRTASAWSEVRILGSDALNYECRQRAHMNCDQKACLAELIDNIIEIGYTPENRLP